MAKMGRPKIDNPKDINVKVRFDKKLHDKLLNYCEKTNMTRTAAIRKSIELLLSEKK